MNAPASSHRTRSALLLAAISVVCLFPGRTAAQIFEIPLQEKVRSAALIVEGTVTDNRSFWDERRELIYTSYLVRASKVFAGAFSGTELEVIVPGGCVGDMLVDVSETPELAVGRRGLFFLGHATVRNSGRAPDSDLRMECVAGPQGFIAYDMTAGSAAAPFQFYPSYERDLYDAVTRLTGQAYRVVGPLLNDASQQGRRKGGAGVAAAPTITSFTPTTATAGTRTVVTITGTNFNATRGTGYVEFKNADDGGATYIQPLNAEYVSWTGTQIQVYVPDNAGTGTIRVTNSDPATATSSSSLTVPWAILNSTFSGEPRRARFLDLNGNGGLSWRMNTAFNGYTGPKAAFIRAMKSWRCTPGFRGGVNWDLDSVTFKNTVASDGIHVVKMSPWSALGAGVLGRCSNYIGKATCGSGTDSTTYVTELDIAFLDTTAWYTGTGSPSGSQIDFESVALHELGHGMQLAHVINSSAVMHYALAAGSTRRAPSTSDTTAANNVLVQSFKNCTCGGDSMRVLQANAGANTSICPGETAILHGHGGITYAWSTSAADTVPVIAVSPASTTSYILTVTSGTCLSDVDTVTVTVNSAPTADAGSNKSVCSGDSVTIGATVSVTIGTVGTGSSSYTNCPYNTTGPDNRTQMLYYASELAAAGLSAGYISHIAMNVTSTANTGPMNNFTVAMKNGTDTSMITGFKSGLTTVLSLSSHTPNAGWDTLYFDTPFLWDGTSNLVVQTCFDNSSTTASAYGVQYTSTYPSYRTGYVTGNGGCTASAGSATSARMNMKFFTTPQLYAWSPATGLDHPATPQPEASPAATTWYELTTTNQSGCSDVDSVLVTVYPVNPTTLTWTGAVNTSWSTVGNWNVPCAVPTAGDTVVIPTATTPPASIPAITLNALTLNNATGTSLGGAVTVSNLLTLTSGTLTLAANNLTIASTGSIAGGSASAFVVTNSTGQLRQQGIGSGGRTGSILFPVGDSAVRYSPATIANTGTADEFRVRVAPEVLGGGTTGSAITSDVVRKTWFIEEAASGGSTASVTLQWNRISESAAFDRANCVVSRHDGSQWYFLGSFAGASGSNPYSRTATSVTTFGPFGVGDNASPLPLELAELRAAASAGAVELSWRTLSEPNLLRFAVERRGDAGWEELGTVPARGSADAPAAYRFVDERPPAGDAALYRLRIEDRAGAASWSDALRVALAPAGGLALDAVYPNPFSGSAVVAFSLPDDADVTVRVYDMHGRRALTIAEGMRARGNHAVTVAARDLAPGRYIVVLQSGAQTQRTTMTVVR